MVANGATLDVGASITGEQLTLNGTGFGSLPMAGISGFLLPRGAVETTGAFTWNGNIILNTANVVISSNAGTLTVNGIVSGANLTKVGANSLTLNGADTFTGSLTISAGTVTLANANIYSGATTVGTTAQLTVNSFGTILNTSSPITVNTGGILLVDDSATLLLNRLAASTGSQQVIALDGIRNHTLHGAHVGDGLIAILGPDGVSQRIRE